ncbi:hypothetical protein [Actinomarinicola tropica]|uniref:Uncharacterized protein n=1 Tax=Actinomarinicola tropica TaxID=2789776 RepID=A0A5Q2RK56_9ACTN|nr:hypothetical protein [Actinomarinicola tropica]QGG94951.1 hypothetical protein GH723_07415 [Actinomarinicola tropica]
MDLGELALPLFSGGAVFDCQPDIWTIVGDGLYVMTVWPSGELGLPLGELVEDDTVFGERSTVDALRTNSS